LFKPLQRYGKSSTVQNTRHIKNIKKAMAADEEPSAAIAFFVFFSKFAPTKT